MIRDWADSELASKLRKLREEMRPYQNELVRRGYSLSEVHGHFRVPVTGFENMCISKKMEIKL